MAGTLAVYHELNLAFELAVYSERLQRICNPQCNPAGGQVTAWRADEAQALTRALDDGGGSAAGRALRASSGSIYSNNYYNSGSLSAAATGAFQFKLSAPGATAETTQGTGAEDEDDLSDDYDGRPNSFRFSDDELKMGVKEAKATLRDPLLLREWKKAKRAAATPQ
ncbi:hypothetical protein T492DRAFT_128368 [Pavlovales sp. CCMP2436]|nr:hypothetical protein T492DRAFT_128368 [Pavlovales sp. CCMP2436]|mmetsp:Transcript_463/g.1297  ORF Transcript_463/g.1297 Transcript_463/m.1297 type:complete len:167 (+) Transcript_463:316-816(+)